MLKLLTTVRTEDEARLLWASIVMDLQECGWEDESIIRIDLAFHEAVANAIKHGNQMKASKKVMVDHSVTREEIVLQITDEGKGFDPADVPDPKTPENLERPCGRGLLLMRHYMTEVTYNATGNQVTMKKIR